MITETREPTGEARPIGYKDRGYANDAKYAKGILTHMDTVLWKKDIREYPQAVNNPLKAKWIPASRQSQT